MKTAFTVLSFVIAVVLMCVAFIRVPTGTGKPGKHGKWLKIIPCMEKSWNLKNDEISWNNHGILL